MEGGRREAEVTGGVKGRKRERRKEGETEGQEKEVEKGERTLRRK